MPSSDRMENRFSKMDFGNVVSFRNSVPLVGFTSPNANKDQHDDRVDSLIKGSVDTNLDSNIMQNRTYAGGIKTSMQERHENYIQKSRLKTNWMTPNHPQVLSSNPCD